MGRQAKTPAPRAPNPIRNQREIRAPTPTFNRPLAKPAARPKRLCPEPTCTEPNIVDGICHSCGAVVDDSNIVSEVAFADDGRGGNQPLGTYVGEGMGAAHNMGSQMRRIVGGGGGGQGSSRDATINSGKEWMQMFCSQLIIPDVTRDQGLQIFKMAATSNFIQGRRIDMVAAVCLYSACRKNKKCNVMLIDFAERLQVNVFKLGHTFKTLHRVITFSKEDWAAVLPEDLMYRFAMKLEFGEMMSTVADTAIKLAKQMSIDWMAMGRRPSGVCGACIIVAARMHNFRRTVTEVVYIVKVTTATLNKRLDEFKMTPSSAMSVADFMNFDPDPAAAAYDPPSFYEKQEEFIKNKKTRKRKRRGELMPDDDEENQEGDEVDPNKRQKTVPNPNEALPTVELRRDADGFAIPPPPPRAQSQSDIADLIDETAENPTDDALQNIASRIFISSENDNDDDDDDEASSITSTATAPKRDRQRKETNDMDIIVPATWSAEEDEIATMISDTLANPKLAELISDPNAPEHSRLYLMAEKKVKQHMAEFEKANPSKNVRDEEELLEDEFANDPEVQNCLLSPEDVARKEQLWVNENKAWLRQQQLKTYQKRMAANGPPKKTRNRKKMVRMGEGQASPAASAGEAAVNVIKARALSKKINYHAINNIFDDVKGPGGRPLGSATTSRATSRTGSSSGSESIDEESEGDDDDYVKPPRSSTSSNATRKQTLHPAEESEDGGDGDDYEEGEPEEEVDSTWKNQGNRGIDEEGEEDDFGEDENDFNDMGEIDVFGEE